ncbi:MAG: septal ring lytic transglycosylase RlpA family protein [Candidatus Aminicenantes bacterium]|nr:septal ring lytic transglycosylase RlpA family protein [Candidatus Aminicenantes bacterium]
MKKTFFVPLLILLAALYSCRPSRPEVSPPPAGFVETGIASWYGQEFHGRPTSSREIFDQNDLTAAHPTLPFGTMVLVTNLENGRQVTVRINDRGPFVKGRIIDLSYAAARLLGLIGPGTARVRLEVTGYEPPAVEPRSGAYILQVGSFAIEENARNLFQKLQKEFPGVYLSSFQTNGRTFHRVRLRAANEVEARQLAEKLSAAGHPVLLLRE